jgi:hypothetical protein
MMARVICTVFVLFCLNGTASAQSAQPYAAPDAELWRDMVQALAELPMSLSSHQRLQQTLEYIQQQARIREARTRTLQSTGPAAPGEAK